MRGLVVVCLFANIVFAFESAASTVPVIPQFHLRRVLDPGGVEGFDLECKSSDTPSPDPDCFLTTLKGHDKSHTVRILAKRARFFVQSFFDGLDPKEIKTPLEPTKKPLHFQRGSWFYWSARLGKQEASGSVDQKKVDKGETERLQSLLELEYSLFRESNG